MDFWMYFGFVYGILFDGRIPARQSLARKSIDLVANQRFARLRPPLRVSPPQLRPLLWTGPPQLRSSASHPTRHHTENMETRKSKICSAKVVHVPRPTRKSHRNTENIDIRLSVCCTSPAPTPNSRKSTEFTKRGQGRADPKGQPQPSKSKVCEQASEASRRDSR